MVDFKQLRVRLDTFFIITKRPKFNLHWSFYYQGKSFQIPIRSSFQCNQVAATINACVQGVGFGMFLSYQVEPYIRSKQLVRILKDYEPISIPVSIIYPHAKLMSTRVRMYIECITVRLREVLNYIE